MDYTKFKVYKKNLVIYYSYSGKVLRYYTGIHLKDLDSKTYESSLRLINQGSIPKNLQIHKGSLSKQKNHIEKKNQELIREHKYLKDKILKLQLEVKKKSEIEENFNQEIDELSKETENLVSEIEKWQM